MDASYGYFLSDPLQVGVRQSLVVNHNRDSRDLWNAVTAPFVNYHFNTDGSVVPYVGALVGAVWNDDDVTGTAGPQAGIKAYLSPSTFIMTNYRYEWFFDDLSDANETQSSQHIVGIGLGYQWK